MILVGLIVILVTLELCFPNTVPGVQELKVRWHTMRLGNSDPDVRVDAADALARMGPKAKRAVPALIEALNVSDPKVCGAAARALGKIGPEAEAAIDPLIRSMRVENAAFRREARRALQFVLGAIEEPETHTDAVEPLIRIMRDNDDWGRQCAAAALAEIGEPAVEHLIPIVLGQDTPVEGDLTLWNKNAPLRRMAGTVLIMILHDDSRLERRIVEPLIAALEKEGEVVVRGAAAYALGRIIFFSKSLESARRAVPFLIATLRERHQVLRLDASLALGMVVMDHELAQKAVPPLITALQDQNRYVREWAAMSLGRIFATVPDPELAEAAIEPLLKALNNSTVRYPSGSYKYHIFVWALIQTGSEDARNAVRNAGFDPDRPPKLIWPDAYLP